MEVCTVGAPKISIGFRSRADLRTALPLRANVVTPGNDTNVGDTGGSVPRQGTVPPEKVSGASANAAWAREHGVCARKQSNHACTCDMRKPVSAAGNVDGACPWRPT
jgi:hypothetical protein